MRNKDIRFLTLRIGAHFTRIVALTSGLLGSSNWRASRIERSSRPSFHKRGNFAFDAGNPYGQAGAFCAIECGRIRALAGVKQTSGAVAACCS